MAKRRLSIMPIVFTIAALCMVVAMTGCAAKAKPNLRMDLPDLHIEVDPDENLPAKFWDVYSILNEGNRLFDEGKFDEAQVLYRKLITHHPDDEMATLAWFNIALCFEETDRFDQALPIYDRLIKEHPKRFHPVEMAFRYAYCYEHLKQWDRVITSLAPVLNHADANEVQKLQARARIAIALFESGEEEEAKGRLRAVLEKYKDFRNRRINADNYYYAKSCFTLGEYYLKRSFEVKLVGDEAGLGALLESKATLFVLARAQYIKAIKSHDPEYVLASTFRIGQGYEQFYFDMLNAPIPDDLDPAERDEYTRKLKKEIQPAFKKSLYFYRKNLSLAGKLNESNQWLVKTKERLDYLENWQKENP